MRYCQWTEDSSKKYLTRKLVILRLGKCWCKSERYVAPDVDELPRIYRGQYLEVNILSAVQRLHTWCNISIIGPKGVMDVPVSFDWATAWPCCRSWSRAAAAIWTAWSVGLPLVRSKSTGVVVCDDTLPLFCRICKSVSRPARAEGSRLLRVVEISPSSWPTRFVKSSGKLLWVSVCLCQENGHVVYTTVMKACLYFLLITSFGCS